MASLPINLPIIDNEPYELYAKGSPARERVDAAIARVKKTLPFDVPVVIGGKEYRTGDIGEQVRPDDVKGKPLAKWHKATPELVQEAITRSVKAQAEWARTPWSQRAAIYLCAAQLLTTKYRDEMMAATMLGQGKNVWQAEADCIGELADFFRFAVKYVNDGYKTQPTSTADSVNTIEYRPLEGFVLAISPFNFSAIGPNLAIVPSILGGVVLWKPSPMAIYANYLAHKILLEAGLPPDVVQFVPGDIEPVVDTSINHRDLAAIHFVGSSTILRSLWGRVGANIQHYRQIPRVVAESGGKNFHLIHPTADPRTSLIASLRSAFEYQGQKCSALSRLYIPKSFETNGWLDELVKETECIIVGPVDKYESFGGPVINEVAFDRVINGIEQAKKEGGKVLAGGTGDKSVGYFVKPTIILTSDPKSYTMKKELFGPVVTVYAYDDHDWEGVCALIDTTTEYALTGAIFSQDRAAIDRASNLLQFAAGNLYINDKTTGAVIGQQPFGGGRSSGTNDKVGSWNHFTRFVSARVIKDNYGTLDSDYRHPSNFV